jgi:hypothetical protein
VGDIRRDPTVLRPDKGCAGGPHLVGTQFESCIYCEAHMLGIEVESLRQQLRGAVERAERAEALLAEALEIKGVRPGDAWRRVKAAHATLGGQ